MANLIDNYDNHLTKSAAWDNVAQAVADAKGMAFDNCHQIFVLMDDEQLEEMEHRGLAVTDPDLDTLHRWFNDSCGLQFINSVRTIDGDRNANGSHTSLIPQGFSANDEDA